MENLVSLDEIDTKGRTLNPGDDLTALIADIRSNGLHVPILVDENMVLIDGLRRLEAVRAMKYSDVNVMIIHNYYECLELVRAAHRTRKKVALEPSPRRVYELWSSFLPFVWKRMRERDFNDRPTTKSRHEFCAMFGDPIGPSYIQAVTDIYREPREGDSPVREEAAKEAQSKVDSREWTVYKGKGYIQRTVEQARATGISDRDQRDVIEGSVVALRGIAHGLDSLPLTLTPRLSKEDLDRLSREYTNAMKTVRRTRDLINRNRRERDR